MEAAGRSIWSTFFLASVLFFTASCNVDALAQAPSAPIETFDVIIGTMCIGDLPESARNYTGQIQQGSDFFRKWTVDWSTQSRASVTSEQDNRPAPASSSASSKSAHANLAAGAAKPKADVAPLHPIIRFFRNAPTGGLGSTCRDLKGDVLLSGKIDRIRLNATSSVYVPGKPAFLRIDAGGMSVTVGHVKSGLATLFGGKLDLSGSKAWIEHSEQLINVEGKPPQGSMEITSWARRLKGAKLVLQEGATPKSLDMSSLRENVTIKVPLTGAITQLLVGGFTGAPSKITLNKFVLPVATFEGASLDVRSVTVERNRKDTLLTLLRTRVGYQTATAMSQRSALSLKSAGLSTIDRLESNTPPFGPALILHSVTLQGLLAKGSQCTSRIADTPFVNAGRCTLAVSKADDNTGQFAVSTENVQSVPFSFAFAPVPATAVAYSITKKSGVETFAGRMTRTWLTSATSYSTNCKTLR